LIQINRFDPTFSGRWLCFGIRFEPIGAVMRKSILASVAVVGLVGSTFGPNTLAAYGDGRPRQAAELQRMQERQSAPARARLGA